MVRGDTTGIAVAAAALVLVAGSWSIERAAAPSVRLGDRPGLARASGMALETEQVGQTVIWRDQLAGVTAAITPARAFRDGSGRWCRPYDLELAADGRLPLPPSHHVACREVSGTWSPLAADGPRPERLVGTFDRWLGRLTGDEQLAETGG